MSNGNTDGFSKTIAALMDEWREGIDPIDEKPGLLVEEFSYSPPSIRAKSYHANIVPVAMDNEGMLASGKGGLEDVLENWDHKKGKRPNLLYTVATGQNPSGALLSVQRRKAIYELCVKYDVIIVEDEPYWYLQYPSANRLSEQTRGKPVSKDVVFGQKYSSTGFQFLDSLVPSYLAFDYQGRVVRLDTFSKTVAPGCRLGWITAQPALIEKLYLYSQQTTSQPSGFVQSIIAQLVMGPSGDIPPQRFTFSQSSQQTGWKIDGWVRWLEGLRGNYERRMNIMCNILEQGKYLLKTGRRRKTNHNIELEGLENDEEAIIDSDNEWRHIVANQIFDFQYPMGGMFVWVRIDFTKHPLAGKYPFPKLANALWVWLTTKPFLVLVAPGSMFSASEEISNEKGWQYFRLCFAAIDDEEVEGQSHRFVNGVQNFWSQKDLDDIESLYEQSHALEVEMRAQGMC
jgi:DNA-binding transcriptional MocR family regulator